MSKRIFGVVAAVLLAALLVPVTAQAASGSFLRLAHLSPDTPAVDVTVTSFARSDWSTTLKGVGYGDVSGYQRIEPGTYTVAMRPAGADPGEPAGHLGDPGRRGRARLHRCGPWQVRQPGAARAGRRDRAAAGRPGPDAGGQRGAAGR